MVGGVIIEVCDVKDNPNALYVDVMHTYQKRNETCAIFIEKNDISQKIEIGDKIWWQGGYAMWTPKENFNSGGKGAGIKYDIEIKRIGFSGVKIERKKE